MKARVTYNQNIQEFTGKATLILINDSGFPICRQITIKKAELKKDNTGYNDEAENLQLIYSEKGKRASIGTRFKENEVAVAQGWQSVSGAFNGEEDGEWIAFNDSAFDSMKAQLKNIVYHQK